MEAPTALGLVYQLPGKLKLTKRLGICVGGTESGQLLLHLSPDEDLEAPVATPLAPDLDIMDLSVAGRVHCVLRRRRAGEIKAKWDEQRLVALADSSASASASGLRRLADEALAGGWSEVFDIVGLRAEEKAWRMAHHAATVRDVGLLHAAVVALPETGYPTRCDLLWPLIGQVLADPSAWIPTLTRWARSRVPDAEELLLAVGGSDDRRSLDHALARLRAVGDPSVPLWHDAIAAMHMMRPGPLPPTDCPTWQALALYEAGMAGMAPSQMLQGVRQLDPTLIDDLIDADAIDESSDLTGFADAAPILARVRPVALTMTELGRVGHVGEQARRHFLSRNRTALAALDSENPVVRRYLALERAREGKPFDEDDVDQRDAQLLLLAARAKKAAASGAATSLPAPILADPTLWPIFAPEARNGHLRPTDEDAGKHPEFAQWVGLQRVLGLVWSADWSGAADLAMSLKQRLASEQLADECQNLAAFALAQMGQMSVALHELDVAMQGEYTENLLINACLLAARSEPAVATAYFSRLVAEAPSNQLRVVALRRAISVWRSGSEVEFPAALKDGLRLVLTQRIDLEDYIDVLRVACDVDHAFVRSNDLPELGAPYTDPRRYFRSYARFKGEEGYNLRDHVDQIVAVHKSCGTPEWLMNDVREWRDVLRDLIFVDFGEALGVAAAVEGFLVGAPELLESLDYYLLAPQAGAHFAVALQAGDRYMSEEALDRFFFVPLDKFIRDTDRFDKNVVASLSDNFSLTLFRATLAYVAVNRDARAEEYNALNARRQWDVQNRGSINSAMRRVLDQSTNNITSAERSLARLRSLPNRTDEGEQARIDLLGSSLQDWRNETAKLRRQC